MKPLARGEGFRFEETVHGGTVPKNYFGAVEAGCRDACERGPLGFPVVDVAARKVVVIVPPDEDGPSGADAA